MLINSILPNFTWTYTSQLSHLKHIVAPSSRLQQRGSRARLSHASCDFNSRSSRSNFRTCRVNPQLRDLRTSMVLGLFFLRGVKQVYTWWIMMICTQKSKPVPNILKAWNMICLDIWFSDDWLRSWGYTSHGWSFEATPVSAGLGSERLMFIIRMLLLRPKLAMQCLQLLHKCTRAPQTRMIKMWESCHHMPPHDFGQQNQGVLTI